MAKALLIAEKPSLMREIQKVYNSHKAEIGIDIDFTAQAGHLVGLKLPKEVNAEKYGRWSISSFPEDYPFEYKVNPGKNELVNNIRKAVKSGGYDFIIHAGDPDQEGELLVRLVLDFVNSSLPVKRFWTNDLVESAILGALKNLQDDRDFDHLYEAALVRQHADYQFGMNGTGVISCKTGELCQTGRVKAAIIALVAQRELEILNYQEKKTYKPAFNYKGCEFVLDQAFDTPELAIAAVPKTEYADIAEAKYELKHSKAPKLFKLSTLQTEMHTRMKWSGDKTLEVLQSLYEAKATSYPRTGCEYISSQVDIGYIAKKILKEVDVSTDLLVRDPGDVLKDKIYANDKAIASEGHTAVIPTGEGLPKNASADQEALYEVICRRFLAMFGNVKDTMSVKVSGVPSGTKDPYIFSESFDVTPGYELILNPKYEMKAGSGIKFEKGQNIHPIEFLAKELVNKKPSRYNDGSLIKAMETPEKYEGEDGAVKYKIGTPATRANIIKECIANGYIKKEKDSFVATEKALSIYAACKDIDLFKPVESGKWEDMLDHIRTGKLDYKEVEETLFSKMEDSVQKIKDANFQSFESKLKGKGGKSSGGKDGAAKETLGECPSCKSAVTVGQYGPYCSGKCGVMFGKVFGKELTNAEWKKVLKGEAIHVKGLVSKKGTKYNATLKPGKIEEFSYTKKDGTKASGKSIHFDMEFEK